MSKGQTLQDPFLNSLRKERIPVSIFLVNGIKLQGHIESFDQYVVLLKNTVSQMVYKHAISTVVPARNPRPAGAPAGARPRRVAWCAQARCPGPQAARRRGRAACPDGRSGWGGRMKISRRTGLMAGVALGAAGLGGWWSNRRHTPQAEM